MTATMTTVTAKGGEREKELIFTAHGPGPPMDHLAHSVSRPNRLGVHYSYFQCTDDKTELREAEEPTS